MSRKKVLGLSILSGVLLGTAWFPPFTFLIFVALVPLLLLTHEILEKSKKPKGSIFLYSYITFLLWNGIDTWWTWFASPGGAVMAILANSILMSLTYLLFFTLYKKFKNQSLSTNHYSPAVWLLIPVWLSFEYLHTHWELAWTWLSLGNVFAFTHNWIQWYEYTGLSGGTLWILAANILVYKLVKAPAKRKIIAISLSCVLVVPILLSLLVNFPSSLKFTKGGQSIMIVQPNIDPYNDKFNSTYESQLQLVYGLVKEKLDSSVNYLVLPETFFTENVWENNLEESYSVKFLRENFLRKYPNLMIITGATTYYSFKPGDKLSPTAHKYTDAEEYYDVFNSALQIDNNGPIQVYHKSKLVPGAERIPYPAVFKPLEKFAIDLGGTVGSLGTQEERGVLFNRDKSVGVAPVICYESVFGEYVTEYINNGANLICIITNDGWWRDTPGYVQHLNYARLRAIETRTPIARCANTGISCFIDSRGDLSQETQWWKPDVISSRLGNNGGEKTFFVKCGDLLSKGALLATLVFIILSFFKRKSSSPNS